MTSPARPPAGAALAQVTVLNRAAWRAWLAANHAQTASVWAVTWRQGHPDHVPQRAVVEEALCWGWIDSLPRKLDAARTMLLVSPRRAGSTWSRLNRDLVERLTQQGLMARPGLAAVAAARASGTWTALDPVERLEIPPDLAAALHALPEAARRFAAFPPSSRRGILQWIAAAKRPQTRAARVARTAELAAQNRKANFPSGRDRGPEPAD